MATYSQPTYFVSGALRHFGNACNVQDALMRGRKASDELKSEFRNHGQLITVGRYIEGVSQDYVLQCNKSNTIVMPYALIKYVRKEDFFPLLEAQQFEHLLADLITGSQTPTGVSNRYFSQVLMTQRLQRALLEVELYAYAISMDGLVLLEDTEGAVSEANEELKA